MSDLSIRPVIPDDWAAIWPIFSATVAAGETYAFAEDLTSEQARSLGEWVVDWHREWGFQGIQFNAVVETNTAAVALWHSLGFVTTGTVPGAFRSRAHGPVGLHVMWLDL